MFRKLCLALMSAVMFAGCGSTSGDEPVPVIPGDIELLSDRTQMRSDGNDAVTFTVNVTDNAGKVHDVTGYAEIYRSFEKTPLESNLFSTDTPGEHVFYAVYGLEVSEDLAISAIDDIPELPEDPQEESLSFKHRMLLVQHTGATCSNCPRMMGSLRTLSQDEDYNGLYHHVASHSYNGGEADDAYSEAARDLSMAYNTSGLYPMLTFNLTSVAVGTDLSEIKEQIDVLKKDSADAGLSAAAELADDALMVNVEVKAAVDNSYRVAAWVLEDDIYSLQSGMSESWHNTHDNALRYAAGKVSQLSFAGEKLGAMKKGDKASHVFVIPMDDSWVAENCEVLVLVTAADEDGNYDVVNCALCPIDGTVAYDYK